jgi:aspartate-semialdehyde dehydrogenase
MVRTAIMGATGAVGQEMIKILEQRAFPCSNLKLLASERSAGKKFPFRGKLHEVELLTKQSFNDIDLVLASAGASVSKEFAPAAVEAGAVVVDNTSAFRMEKEVPLVVPEVNSHALVKHKGIIANPNCSTIQMVVVLNPIHKAVGIKRLVIATYQSVSGTGSEAIEELLEQTRTLLAGKRDIVIEVYPHQIAFNCLPHIDVFLENGYSKEEMKMVNETRKILEDDTIAITATTVRVPVIRCHSEAVNIETKKKITAKEVRALLAKAPGVAVVDNLQKNEYPLPIYGENRDETYVGRIREDISCENGIDLWIVSDNLRKGAALNAIQIAEEMLRRGLLKSK